MLKNANAMAKNIDDIVNYQKTQEAVKRETERIKAKLPSETDLMNKLQEVYNCSKEALLREENLRAEIKELKVQNNELQKQNIVLQEKNNELVRRVEDISRARYNGIVHERNDHDCYEKE